MNVSSALQQGCEAYVDYFEKLDKDNVNQLKFLAADTMVFEDPFQRLECREEICLMFEKMFEYVSAPSFDIQSVYWQEGGTKAILKWKFTGFSKRLGYINYLGLSEIEFNQYGQVTAHIDYWDSGTHFYSKLPLIGLVVDYVKRRVKKAHS